MAAVAVNEYQTSSSGVPVAQPVGMPELVEASQTDPELLVVPIVKAVAVPQSSFVGGGVYNTHTLTFHLLAGFPVGEVEVNTRK
ncbi:MAG TPA: hypothetical protein V6C65_14775 [Allocoleopsis sp.]